MTPKKTKKTKTSVEQAAAIVEQAVVTAAAAAEPEPKPYAGDEAPKMLSLTTEEVLRLRLHESEVVRWGSDAQLKNGRRLAYIQKIDPEGQMAKMEEEVRASAVKSQQAKQQYEVVTKRIEARLGIKLTNYSFDDETGTLIPH